jgi:hypothetical protein
MVDHVCIPSLHKWLKEQAKCTLAENGQQLAGLLGRYEVVIGGTFSRNFPFYGHLMYGVSSH